MVYKDKDALISSVIKLISATSSPLHSTKSACTLTFTTLWPNSADNKLMMFSCFPRKQDLTFHANCLQRRQFI